MSEKIKRVNRMFSHGFRLSVLVDYYSSGASKGSISRKYGLSAGLLNAWLRRYEEELLSLPEELSALEEKLYMARKKSISTKAPAHPAALSVEEELLAEVERLRKALSYSELRVEALNEVLRISKEKYGIDLLKKAGAKQ